MAVTQFAWRLTCDYPGCQSVGEAMQLEQPPAGWLSLRGAGMEVRNAYGVTLGEFCSLHANVPLSKLADQLRMGDKDS